MSLSPPRVLHAYNLQRGGGGAGIAARATIAALARRGVEIHEFVRDSRTLAPGLAGNAKAFASGLYARAAVRDFAVKLETCRPDVVHVHELYPLITPWVLPVCQRAGVPVVMSAYDYRLTCPTHNHFRDGRVCTSCLESSEWSCVRHNCRGNLPESVAYAARNAVAAHFDLFRRHVALFLTPTSFTADWLVTQAGIDRGRVQAIACAVELADRPVDPCQGRYVGFAGRMVAEKGIAVLTAAARLARLPVRLALGAAEDLSLHENDAFVTHLQTRSRAELAEFYAGARFLVVPSIWFETGPLVIGEAMGHGLPVIASNIGALAQMVDHERTGLLFKTGDADDLARQMLRLWNEPELCRRLGAAAREHACRSASPAAHGEAVLQAYLRVLGRSA